MDKNKLLSEFRNIKHVGVLHHPTPPSFWIDTGNYALNKMISGNYMYGFAQGRMAAISGPSQSGKSYLLGNVIKRAQDDGCGILLFDSENALDEKYLLSIGVNISANDFLYRGVKSIEQVTDIISKFLKLYRDTDAPGKFFIGLDSVNALLTKSDDAAYKKGNVVGDFGGEAKQIKQMLNRIMQDIKDLDIVFVCTQQPYKEQDLMKAMAMPWVITDAFKFAFSQIILVTKLQLKDKTTKLHTGITLKAFGYKTRFTKPFQVVKIEVPYDTGMDEFNGLLDIAQLQGIVIKTGGWYKFKDDKFQESKSAKYMQDILQCLISADNGESIKVVIGDDEIELD